MYAFNNPVLIKKQQSSIQYPFLFQEFSKEPMEFTAFENPCLFAFWITILNCENICIVL